MKKSERRKLSPDGLPIDPREWLEEDWHDLHEAIDGIKKRVSERHTKVACSKPKTDWREKYESLRKQLLKMCSMFSKTQRNNQSYWMQLACKVLNESLAALADEDRLAYSRESGCFEVVTK